MQNNKSIPHKLGESFERMPGTAQFVVIAVAIIFVWVLVKRMSKHLKIISDINNGKLEANAFTANGEKNSYLPTEYESLANKLFRAMDGMGTDDTAVEEVFNAVKNNLDFLALKAAFGIRKSYTFDEWIAGDLSENQIDQLNNLFKTRGIVYRL